MPAFQLSLNIILSAWPMVSASWDNFGSGVLYLVNYSSLPAGLTSANPQEFIEHLLSIQVRVKGWKYLESG